MFLPALCKKLWLVPMLSTVVSCSSQPPAKESAAPPVSKDGKVEILVEEGESSQAVFSPKGDRLLFVSKKRVGHSQDQVYEKDLATGTERRLTYQNGSTFRPQYHPKENWIIYSSSTDELKENPPLLRPTPEKAAPKVPYPYLEPMEVYIHSLKEFDIMRLTEHPGFDGEAKFSPDGSTVIFTRMNGPRSEVVSFNRVQRSAHIHKNLGDNPTEFVSTADGKAHAWIDWDEGFTKSRLRVQKGTAEARDLVALSEVPKSDLIFSPDGKWLLWAQKDNDGYDLWGADLETLCVRRLSAKGEGERRFPALSPDLKSLTFTLIWKNRSRIARMDFSPPTGTCPPAP